MIGSRVRLQGFVHRLRIQKTHYFLIIRDGTAFVQCILTGDCIRTVDALDLTVESTVEIVGTVEKVKEGQSAPGGVEVMVDWWKIIGKAPGGSEAFEGRLRAVSCSNRNLDELTGRTLNHPFEQICVISSCVEK
jgi:asparaginyl-tRNA synthetase